MAKLVNKEIFVKKFVIDNSDNFKHPVLVLGYRFIEDYKPSENELKNLSEDVYLMPFRKYQMHPSMVFILVDKVRLLDCVT